MPRNSLLRFTILVVLTTSATLAQIITTVVGTDWHFPSGSIAAVNAPLGEVTGVAVDTAGNVFVADSNDGLVLRVSVNGTLNVVAGNGISGFSGDGGPATSASLNGPAVVALDSAGNLYIVDLGNNRIREVSGGTITTVAGNGTAGFSGDGGPATGAALNFPNGVAVDSAGNVYIVDAGNSRIRKISAGTITTIAGNGLPASLATEGRPPTHRSAAPVGWPSMRPATSTSPTTATSGFGKCLAGRLQRSPKVGFLSPAARLLGPRVGWPSMRPATSTSSTYLTTQLLRYL